MSKASSSEASGGGLKVIAIILLLGAIGWYAWSTMQHYGGMEPEPVENSDGTQAQRPGPPSPEQREQMRTRMRETMRQELNLTDDQQAKIDALISEPMPDSREERRARFEQMQQVLTPEQQEKARELRQNMRRQFMQRRMEEMAKTANPEDMAAMQQRFEEMQRRFGDRGPGGGGPPPNGPPPEGAPR